jgi:Zn-dependent protease with chaperone function
MFQFSKRAAGFQRRFSSFWGRLIILVALVLLASVFNVMPFGLLKAAAALGFLVSAEALVLAWYRNLGTRTVDWFKITFRLLSRRGIEKRPLTPGMEDVARKMGLDIREFWIMDGLDNAFSLPMWKVVVFGQPVFARLHERALNAVFAHEGAHIKGRHNLLPILPWLVLSSQLIIWRSLPFQMLVIAGFAFYLLASIPVSWMMELLADRKASSIVGADAMIEALELLCNDKMDAFTETHPAPSARIRRLRKGPVPRMAFTLWMGAWVVGSYALLILTL